METEKENERKAAREQLAAQAREHVQYCTAKIEQLGTIIEDLKAQQAGHEASLLSKTAPNCEWNPHRIQIMAPPWGHEP